MKALFEVVRYTNEDVITTSTGGVAPPCGNDTGFSCAIPGVST